MSFKVGQQTLHVCAALNAIQRSDRRFNANLLADPLPCIRRRSFDSLSVGLIVAHCGDRLVKNEFRIVMIALHLLPSI